MRQGKRPPEWFNRSAAVLIPKGIDAGDGEGMPNAHGLGRGARVDERARDSVQVEGLRLGGVARVVGRGVCYESGGRTRWCKAWHRCKLEAVYSIMGHGRLRASWCMDQGHRFFENMPGVCALRDGEGRFDLGRWRILVDSLGGGGRQLGEDREEGGRPVDSAGDELSVGCAMVQGMYR